MPRTSHGLDPKTSPSKVNNFDSLVGAIIGVHERLQFQTAKAVNASLTLRNWLIGRYIAEFQLCGADRAIYGDRLLDALSIALRKAHVSSMGRRQLYGYLIFYRVYPQIVRTLSAQLGFPSNSLLNQLSYSHFEKLIELEDPLKRAFYEAECFRGNWSVRELRRQIASLYYERSSLSKDKRKLSQITQAKAEPASTQHVIRDPYIFEFLGLKPKEVMDESALENSLFDKLQDFLLELGRGFCFEARRKRILIGGEHYFVDLVFYHRILKCHVLIELKADEFSHQHLGQLNTYVNWYREHEMAKGDNPPIGILLCTQKNHALVKYALAGIDNRLFVSKYRLELPKQEEIRRFLAEQIKQQSKRPMR